MGQSIDIFWPLRSRWRKCRRKNWEESRYLENLLGIWLFLTTHEMTDKLRRDLAEIDSLPGKLTSYVRSANPLDIVFIIPKGTRSCLASLGVSGGTLEILGRKKRWYENKSRSQ